MPGSTGTPATAEKPGPAWTIATAGTATAAGTEKKEQQQQKKCKQQ